MDEPVARQPRFRQLGGLLLRQECANHLPGQGTLAIARREYGVPSAGHPLAIARRLESGFGSLGGAGASDIAQHATGLVWVNGALIAQVPRLALGWIERDQIHDGERQQQGHIHKTHFWMADLNNGASQIDGDDEIRGFTGVLASDYT